MPLGKYYCDYCDKEFQDTPLARSRHLRSSSHLRAKSLWYNSLHHSSSQPTPASAFVKGLCNRFVNTGFCPYGNSCKYLHATATQATGSWGDNVRSPIVPGSQLVGGSSLAGGIVRDSMGMPWGNLPPSLIPPPEGGYPPVPFVDWG